MGVSSDIQQRRDLGVAAEAADGHEDPGLIGARTEMRERGFLFDPPDPAFLEAIGFTGKVPSLSNSTVFLASWADGSRHERATSIIFDPQLSLNSILVSYNKLVEAMGRSDLGIVLGAGVEEMPFVHAVPKGEPKWLLMPTAINNSSLGVPKLGALEVEDSASLCDPRQIALLVAYHQLHRQVPFAPLLGQATFTAMPRVIVGQIGEESGVPCGIHCLRGQDVDRFGSKNVGLLVHRKVYSSRRYLDDDD